MRKSRFELPALLLRPFPNVAVGDCFLPHFGLGLLSQVAQCPSLQLLDALCAEVRTQHVRYRMALFTTSSHQLWRSGEICQLLVFYINYVLAVQ